MMDAVGIGGRSEEEIGAEEYLERNGMGRNKIWNLLRIIVRVFFVIFNYIF